MAAPGQAGLCRCFARRSTAVRSGRGFSAVSSKAAAAQRRKQQQHRRHKQQQQQHRRFNAGDCTFMPYISCLVRVCHALQTDLQVCRTSLHYASWGLCVHWLVPALYSHNTLHALASAVLYMVSVCSHSMCAACSGRQQLGAPLLVLCCSLCHQHVVSCIIADGRG